MGHADVDTTMRYLHHRSRADEALKLADALKVQADLQAPEAEAAANLFPWVHPAPRESPLTMPIRGTRRKGPAAGSGFPS
jgi:hypothetical protein